MVCCAFVPLCVVLSWVVLSWVVLARMCLRGLCLRRLPLRGLRLGGIACVSCAAVRCAAVRRAAVRRVPCAVCRVPCAVCRVPSVVCRLSCAVCRVPSVVCRLSCAVCRVPSVVCRLSCAVCRAAVRRAAVCRVPSVVCRLSCAVCRVPSVVCRLSCCRPSGCRYLRCRLARSTCPPPTHVGGVTANRGRTDSARPSKAVFPMICAISERAMSSPPASARRTSGSRTNLLSKSSRETREVSPYIRVPRLSARAHSHRSLLPLELRTANSLSARLSTSLRCVVPRKNKRRGAECTPCFPSCQTSA
jgi:hypothetical protein